ncbi:Semaphorin-4E [Chelonia mydas]|uniref:Semaphorin-4E n=1 Tax=Chelonia mydas TaxID=8469 RepID=M7AWD6_CHEMY|nr:Semaphorin-4E [Chelonia mydas]
MPSEEEVAYSVGFLYKLGPSSCKLFHVGEFYMPLQNPNEKPSFVYMDMVQESESNPDGDDDKIYVFFTETAVEFEFYDKLLVSRIARVCKCIDNFARSIGYNTSLDLPDKILQFVRDHPLMDNAVNPVGDRPVLLKRGSNYTRIVVDRITGLDKKTYDVLFIGTVCSRYKHCLDCVLARDPYCAWSESFEKCVLVANQTGDLKDLIQSVKNGDASRCPKVGNNVRNCPVIIGNSVHLKCAPMSNLARMVWKFNGSSLQAEDSKYLLYDGGIVIFNVTVADAGFYDCHSVERANGKEFPVTVASYVLYTQKDSVFIITKNYTTNQPNADTTLKVKSLVSSSLLTDPAKQKSLEDQKEKLILKLLGAGFALLFSSLLVWNFCKGHLSVPWKSRERSSKTANADCLPGPTLATEGSGAVRKSSATRTNTSTVNESVPLVSSPSEEERSANVQHNTSLTKRSGTCSSQSCLVEDETMFPIEECGM